MNLNALIDDKSDMICITDSVLLPLDLYPCRSCKLHSLSIDLISLSRFSNALATRDALALFKFHPSALQIVFKTLFCCSFFRSNEIFPPRRPYLL